MEYFAVITLVIILLGLQHLLSFLWRMDTDSEATASGVVFVTLFVIVISYIIIYHIIKWGAPLI